MTMEPNLQRWLVDVRDNEGTLNKDVLMMALKDYQMEGKNVIVTILFVLTEVPSHNKMFSAVGPPVKTSQAGSKTLAVEELRIMHKVIMPSLNICKYRKVQVESHVEKNDNRADGLTEAASKLGAERLYVGLKKRMFGSGLSQYDTCAATLPGCGCGFYIVQGSKKLREIPALAKDSPPSDAKDIPEELAAQSSLSGTPLDTSTEIVAAEENSASEVANQLVDSVAALKADLARSSMPGSGDVTPAHTDSGSDWSSSLDLANPREKGSDESLSSRTGRYKKIWSHRRRQGSREASSQPLPAVSSADGSPTSPGGEAMQDPAPASPLTPAYVAGDATSEEDVQMATMLAQLNQRLSNRAPQHPQMSSEAGLGQRKPGSWQSQPLHQRIKGRRHRGSAGVISLNAAAGSEELDASRSAHDLHWPGGSHAEGSSFGREQVASAKSIFRSSSVGNMESEAFQMQQEHVTELGAPSSADEEQLDEGYYHSLAVERYSSERSRATLEVGQFDSGISETGDNSASRAAGGSSRLSKLSSGSLPASSAELAVPELSIRTPSSQQSSDLHPLQSSANVIFEGAPAGSSRELYRPNGDFEHVMVDEANSTGSGVQVVLAKEADLGSQHDLSLDVLEQRRQLKEELNQLRALRIQAEERSKNGELVRLRLGFNLYSAEDVAAACNDFDSSYIIGEGSFGMIYRGSLDHTPVAIKRLKPTEQPTALQDFRKEVTIQAGLRHPNVVILMGCCENPPCVIYELMTGGSLLDRLLCKDGTPPLPWWSRFDILENACKGLLHLHHRDPPIVHRDLKPANILLDRNLTAKIADIGLAYVMEPGGGQSFAQQTMAVGTLGYMDPRFLQHGQFSPRSDVYSLGMVILDLLGGLTSGERMRAGPEFAAGPSSSRLSQSNSPAREDLCEAVASAIDDTDRRRPDGAAKLVMTVRQLTDLEPSAGHWPPEVAIQLARLAVGCTQLHYKKRPDLGKVVMPALKALRPVVEAELSRMAFSSTMNSSTPSLGSSGRAAGGSRSIQGAAPQDFLCPITMEVMDVPVMAADGFSYEEVAIKIWLRSNTTSPKTNLPLAHQNVVVNKALLSAILEWKGHVGASAYS